MKRNLIAVQSIKHTVSCVLVFMLMRPATDSFSQIKILSNAFSHNDYKQKAPLFSALECGITNIEADVFLYNGKLVVTHFIPVFRSGRTLENLYLEPLLKYFQDKAPGETLPPTVTLMIDIKSNARRTYEALRPLLSKYTSILSVYSRGSIMPGRVTVVISGHKPLRTMKNEEYRLAFVDADLSNMPVNGSMTNGLYYMASTKYSKEWHWNGNTMISDAEYGNLKLKVNMAHSNGVKVRLWASPENELVWNKLIKCGVDFITTDNLPQLTAFLRPRSTDFLHEHPINP